MPTAAQRLLRNATDALCTAPVTASVPPSVNESVAVEWAELLLQRNGFCTLDGALLVLPTRTSRGVPGVTDFNKPSGWKRFYALEPFFAIALDTLGWPIGIREDGLARLNPETGSFEPLGASLVGFSERLHKGTVDIGQSIATRWKQSFAELGPSDRLVPRRPRAIGGTVAVSNLRKWPIAQVAETYGTLALQLRRMEDGTESSLSWAPGRPG